MSEQLTFVGICARCGQILDVIPNEGQNWNEPVCWGYLAQREHDKTHHPEHQQIGERHV